MTEKNAAPHQGLTDGRVAIKLQRDKDGQFFELPKGWKFTNGQVTAHFAACAIVLKQNRPGKLKLPVVARRASDYPKKSVGKLVK
jgi:hypothetical protein